jgi:teichuronic acid biosynthesis glycosyltransferase TuaC
MFVRRVPDARLVFVGDGEDRASLERAAAESGVSDRIHVTGFVPPRQVATWLNAADLVVVGSHTEGWSVAMLEALGCGKAIVSTAVSGASEMIEQGVNGFVVRSRSPEEFHEAMLGGIALTGAARASLKRARDYDIANLGRRVGAAWKVLA